MAEHPLSEVFGYPYDDFRDVAKQHRQEKLCPYNNIVKYCTKDRKADPLGVCSMDEGVGPIIICPTRFKESWRIIDDAKPFLLPYANKVDFVTEPTLKDAGGNTVGKIDIVLVEHDKSGKVLDFAPLEVQSVYITGNIRNPFAYYLEDPHKRHDHPWEGDNYPRPDWLSSVKRLIHQITAKGTIIINAWGKKIGIAIQHQFFESFPLFSTIPEVSNDEADCAWFLYDLTWDSQTSLYGLQLERIIYFRFEDFLNTFASTEAGDIQDFTSILEKKLSRKIQKI